MSDEEIKFISKNIFKFIYGEDKNENILQKINIYFSSIESNYSKPKLIHIKHENLPHLIGIQYYKEILNKKINDENMLKSIFYELSTSKLNFSSIIKKIRANWKNLKKKNAFKKIAKSNNLIYFLENKIICLYELLQLYSNSNLYNFYYSQHKKSNTEYWFLFNKNNDNKLW